MIGRPTAFNLGTKFVCNALVVVLCWLPDKIETLSVKNDMKFFKNGSTLQLHNAANATQENNTITAEDVTPGPRLVNAISTIQTFEEETDGSNGITTEHGHSSTSESTLPELASFSAGFDHASLEPSDPNSSSVHVPTIRHQGSAVNNISPRSRYSKNKLKKYINKRIKCGHFTLKEDRKRLYTIHDVHHPLKDAEPCRFWVEGVASTVVAVSGLTGNLISIWVLSDDELRTGVFNRLLRSLAVVDCMFILPGAIIYTAKAFSWQADWYNRSFPVFIYPFTEIAFCSSIYMTVAIAVERYLGVCRPFQRLSGSYSAKTFITLVGILAISLNIPKFFESETIYKRSKEDNTTVTSIGVTRLRMNPDYITYYWMWTRLLITGIIPFVLLALLNAKIYLGIRKSKHQLRTFAIRYENIHPHFYKVMVS